MSNTRLICLLLACVMMTSRPPHVSADQLRAGAAKVDITDRKSGPVNDPLHARALVVNDGSLTLVVVTMDVVAIGEIGNIGNDFLPGLRHRIQKEIGIPPEHVLVNASPLPWRALRGCGRTNFSGSEERRAKHGASPRWRRHRAKRTGPWKTAG